MKVLEEELKRKGYGMEMGGGVVPFLMGPFQKVAEDTGMDDSRKMAVACLFFGRAGYRRLYRSREAPEDRVVENNVAGETDVPELDGYEFPQSPPWEEESDESRRARTLASTSARMRVLHEACGDARDGQSEEVTTVRQRLDDINWTSETRQRMRQGIEEVDFQWDYHAEFSQWPALHPAASERLPEP